MDQVDVTSEPRRNLAEGSPPSNTQKIFEKQ